MKLAEALKIVQATSSADADKFIVYLACGIFPLHLTIFLAVHISERLPERAIEIRTGLYGDLPENLEQLQKSSAHAGAVVIEWSDLTLGSNSRHRAHPLSSTDICIIT